MIAQKNTTLTRSRSQIRQRYKDSGAKKAFKEPADEGEGEGEGEGGEGKITPTFDDKLKKSQTGGSAMKRHASMNSGSANMKNMSMGSAKSLMEMQKSVADNKRNDKPINNGRKKSFIEVHRASRVGGGGYAGGNSDKIDNEMHSLKLQISTLQRGMLDLGNHNREIKNMMRFLVEKEQQREKQEEKESESDGEGEEEGEGEREHARARERDRETEGETERQRERDT